MTRVDDGQRSREVQTGSAWADSQADRMFLSLGLFGDQLHREFRSNGRDQPVRFFAGCRDDTHPVRHKPKPLAKLVAHQIIDGRHEF